ncbi:3-dehydroquinate synthase [Chromobacterium violaceum]|uniref:3-dehydroquinate synthase n=1 Tax=Chromobacterium violaceum TaxID=536 RepID=UPI0009DAEB6A|nr:3-dehydroquinate synthase [Chromobacterium violaceum]MBX9269540.1 3-dehydroquinate synthase [Chromobacterium violaceum]OQS45075.1 3-dehydroquinate synthase [Chromobacterium violaceum]OQS46409.1 3-dehydroquinate synthase [Chromobacterium violaceum]QRO33571.1 3-dehydroquinate synthase [Chromobacterium violaceum]QRQ16625.1 3-dehydroquinate synthase [Chromobacterium violaceum]
MTGTYALRPLSNDSGAETDDKPDSPRQLRLIHDFSVVHTRDVFAADNPVLLETLRRREADKRHRVAVFVDDGVLRAYPELPQRIRGYAQAHAAHLEIIGEIVPVPGGEACKNDPQQLWRLLQALADRNIDRHSYALAIGGGAALDAVGLAASLFHRGVRHIRLPSTVLSQADSGVGVKNAINWNGQKNLLGSFAVPWAVINDAALIDGLPAREKRAGMAEAVKVALIRDASFFRWLEARADALARFEPRDLEQLIRRSAALHLRQITQGGDPFEQGSARPLDYGHWIAHKLERLSGHALNHGEAVAIGVACDARHSVLAGLLPEGGETRVWQLLRALGFELWHEQLLARDEHGRLALLRGLDEFREHLGGDLCVTLLAELGRGCEVDSIAEERVMRSILWLQRCLASSPASARADTAAAAACGAAR